MYMYMFIHLICIDCKVESMHTACPYGSVHRYIHVDQWLPIILELNGNLPLSSAEPSPSAHPVVPW